MEDKKKTTAEDAKLKVGEMSTEADSEFADGREDGENE